MSTDSEAARPAGDSGHLETLSQALASANSVEQRAEIWERYLEARPAEFTADCADVAELLETSDLEGLIAHASRHAGERAAARSALIRDTRFL